MHPGDGKFDQLFIPGKVKLMCGRVDLTDLSFIDSNDTLLMQRYVQKDHDYRFKIIDPGERGLVDDNFGYLGGEKFAACGWRNFYALLDSAHTDSGDYFTDMSAASYRWSYACGQGTFTSCQGIGITQDFSLHPVKNIFTMILGSYFGDWNSWNDFMRAPLAAQGWTLNSCWSGRPFWLFHHMGLGEPIGYSAMVTQNNYGIYDADIAQNQVHIALLGDPTLREHIVAPASGIDASSYQNSRALIQWTASADSVLGYFIYRSPEPIDSFTLLNPVFINSTSFIDSFPPAGNQCYMVRAVRLQQSNTGTYYNLSQGITDTAFIRVGINEMNSQDLSVTISPNPFTSHSNIYIKSMDDSQKFDVVITNSSGMTVRKFTSTTGFTFFRNELATGNYSLSIYRNSRLAASRKIIIQ